MNCVNHAELPAKLNCPRCQRPFCAQCLIRVGNDEICLECFRQRSGSSQVRPNAAESMIASPGLAFGLGWIPGVGAIYNGEYLKAFIHVVIFGFLISVSHRSHVGSFESLFSLLTTAFYFYMPLEAFHTAKRRVIVASGQAVVENKHSAEETLWTGSLLIFLGCLLFLNEFINGFIEQIFRFWPLVLIIFGAYKIWRSFGYSKVLKVVAE